LKVEIVDLPCVYHYKDKHFLDFFTALSKAENYAYFDKVPIQKLIEFNYTLTKDTILAKMFYPFAFFQFFFVIYSNLVYEFRNDPEYFYTFWSLVSILIVFALYFFGNEMRQLTSEGPRYFLSVWNYIDLIPPITLMISLGLTLAERFGYEMSSLQVVLIQVISTFFMWTKFLYFLRIYESTGYLVRMIMQVIYDMKVFLFLLLLTVVAFGDSLSVIA
jgi:hypothetical protein